MLNFTSPQVPKPKKGLCLLASPSGLLTGWRSHLELVIELAAEEEADGREASKRGRVLAAGGGTNRLLTRLESLASHQKGFWRLSCLQKL